MKEKRSPIAKERKAEAEDYSEEAGGVQAAETGTRVLEALTELGPAPMLKTIAERAGMPPAKAHRYLTSFVRTGLASRDPYSGRYTLGPLSLRMGLIALRRLDIIKVASSALLPLHEKLQHSVFLAVWGTHGATIVRTEETDDPVVIRAKAGSVMPLLPSATGRVFGAYLPTSETKQIIARELKQNPKWLGSYPDPDSLFKDVRSRGLSRTIGDLNQGIHAISAPIFDHDENLAGAITALGVVGAFDADWDGPTAAAVRLSADIASSELGFKPERRPHEYKSQHAAARLARRR
jgi:DNA-binding IclR family transcriptional regulator